MAFKTISKNPSTLLTISIVTNLIENNQNSLEDLFANLLENLNGESNPKKYKCGYCQNEFTKNKFEQHIKNCGTGNHLHNCIYCDDYTASNIHTFMRHVEICSLKLKLPVGEDVLAKEDTQDENICKVCYENKLNTINFPCCQFVCLLE